MGSLCSMLLAAILSFWLGNLYYLLCPTLGGSYAGAEAHSRCSTPAHMVCYQLSRCAVTACGWCRDEPLFLFPFRAHHHLLRLFLCFIHHCQSKQSSKPLVLCHANNLLLACCIRRILAHISLPTFRSRYIRRNGYRTAHYRITLPAFCTF